MENESTLSHLQSVGFDGQTSWQVRLHAPQRLHTDPYGEKVCCHAKNWNKPVFIGVIQLLQDRQKIVPSIVRLRPLEKCSQFGRQFSDAVGARVPEGSFTFKNRGIDPLIEAGIANSVEVPQKMIEDGAKVIADISDDEAEIIRDRLQDFSSHDALSTIVLSYFVLDKAIALTIVEPLKTLLEIIKV